MNIDNINVDKIHRLIGKYKVVHSQEEIIYNGDFLKIKKGVYSLADGSTLTREIMVKKSEEAVVVLAVTKEGRVVLVVEPRVATKEGVGVSLPAGCVEEGENPVVAGLRELEEETGYTTDNAYLIDGYYPSEGASGEYVYVVLALDCVKSSEQKLDKDEYISVVEVDYDNVFELMKQHIIKNGHSRVALYETKDMVSDYLKKSVSCRRLGK